VKRFIAVGYYIGDTTELYIEISVRYR